MKKEVVIEIPKGSNIKYELDTKTNKLYVDRILYGANVYPQNYGFFENTLDWDGDPLDALVFANHAFLPGSILKTRILGIMHMIDGGETDSKILAVIDNDPRFEHIKTFNDIPKHLLAEIQDFFENYKNLQNKKVVIKGFDDTEEAIKELKVCEELYSKYKDMDKDDFIAKMKKEHPKKYEY